MDTTASPSSTSTRSIVRLTIVIPTTEQRAPRDADTGAPVPANVPEMIDAITRAAVALAPAPFVVRYDDGEWIVAVTDQDDPRACVYADEAARAAYATRETVALLPTWARASPHPAQQEARVGSVYAQQYGSTGSTDCYRIVLEAPNDASVWFRAWQSPRSDIVAPNEDEAAQLLWQHLGCPRRVGLMVVPSTGPALWYNVEDWTIAAGAPYWEPVHVFPALTRRDALAGLPADIDPVVVAIHESRTTSARHASRCRAAQAVLIQYVLDECWAPAPGPGESLFNASVTLVGEWVRTGNDTPARIDAWHERMPRCRPDGYTAEEAQRIIAAIAAFELHGRGGSGGIDGGSTDTMSWRRGLGKGRRQASDGQAWDAAIQEVVFNPHSWTSPIGPADALLAAPFVRPYDLEWPMAYALYRAYEACRDADEARAWCDVARAVMARAEEPGAPLYGPAVRLGQRYGVQAVRS